MGLNDKISNSTEKGLGQAKEEAGKLLNDEELQHEGRADQASAGVKQAGEKIKDAVSEAGDNIKSAAQKLKDGFTK